MNRRHLLIGLSGAIAALPIVARTQTGPQPEFAEGEAGHRHP